MLNTSLARSEIDNRQQAGTLNLLKAFPSLGFDNVLANWTFMKFLEYFGDEEVRPKSGYQLSPEFFETILTHDPYYRYFYLFLSVSTTLYAGQPEKTVDMMQENLQNLTPLTPTDSYYIWRYKGTDELLFLGNIQAARQSFETAADWANQSTHIDSVLISEISRNMAQVLSQKPDSKAAKISAWSSVLSNAIDDNARARATQEIRNLGGDVQKTPEGTYKIVFPNED